MVPMVHYRHSSNYNILRAILSYLFLEFNIMHWLPIWLSVVTRGYPSYFNIYFDDVIDDVTGYVTKFVFCNVHENIVLPSLLLFH